MEHQLRLLRNPDVRAKCGSPGKPLPPSTLFHLVRIGLLPPQIKMGGGKSAFWLEHEIDTILCARISGATNDEIRALVEKLVSDRKNKAPTEMAAASGGAR